MSEEFQKHIFENFSRKESSTVSGIQGLRVLVADEFYAYIIDWLMPDMNGIETVRRIRRLIGHSNDCECI